MTIANSFAAKLTMAVVAIAMMFSLAAPAKAQTVEELQAQIDALMATINQLQAQLGQTSGGGSSSGSCEVYHFTRSLTVGMSGPDVTALQNYLISEGFSIPAGATGYFGSQTKAAVAAWQAANGVSPAVGYFGPISRAKYEELMAAKCASMNNGGSDDNGGSNDNGGSDDSNNGPTLGNGEGSIDSVTSASADDSNVREGETNGIFAFDMKIEGDVEVDRVDIYMDSQAAGSESNDADDYFTKASLYVDGDKVATLDVNDWDEDSYNRVSVVTGDADEYRLRFSGLGLVFADGDEPEVQLALTGAKNIDTADMSETWGVELENDSIRYVDGKGFTDTAGANLSDTFGLQQEETAELQFSESDNNPDANVVQVDDNDLTEDVPFLVFEVKEKNGVDATIEDMTVTVVAGAPHAASVDAVVAEAAIYDGSKKLDSANVPSNGVVNFENMGLDINADDTVELTVKLTLEDTNNQTAYTDGQTVAVNFTSLDDAVDENGNDENDMTVSGTPSGNTMTLREVGVSPELVSESTTLIENDTATNADDAADLKVVFDVTAFGDDLYLPYGSNRTSTLNDGVIWEILDDNNVVVAGGTTTPALDVADSSAEKTNSYKVAEGATERFTLTVTYDPAAAGAYKLRVKEINFATTDVAVATDTQDVSALDIDTSKVTIQN